MSNIKKLFLLLAVLSSGCRSLEPCEPPANYYYLNPNKDLCAIGRVTLVELANNSSFPQISADMTEALFQELQKKQIFGLTVARQIDPHWQSLQLELNTTYTFEQLSTIRKIIKTDALLVGTITEYKPYPHLTIGLHLRLIDLTDGQLLWALEQIWDTSDKTTEDRIKNYYSHHNIIGFPVLREKLGTISSLRFVKFVAYETAKTMKPERSQSRQPLIIGLK
jgi:hypothetical protein